jgi:hypothetical protein
MDASLARVHITAVEVNAWLDEHVDVGTYVILDDADGKESCGHLWGFEVCSYGRPTCPHAARIEKSLLRFSLSDEQWARLTVLLAPCVGVTPDEIAEAIGLQRRSASPSASFSLDVAPRGTTGSSTTPAKSTTCPRVRWSKASRRRRGRAPHAGAVDDPDALKYDVRCTPKGPIAFV